MARRRKGRAVHGWIVLDKPVGVTSTNAVARVKRMFQAAKAGHAGTLDPLASGILPIALGEATKTVPFVVDGLKSYRFTVRWGEETETDDNEGEVTQRSDLRPSLSDIERLLPDFTGEIEQVPPRYSAIKVEGARAYDLARGGDEFQLAARLVQVNHLVILELPDKDHAIFEAECGKGTYVRSLARDLGRALGCYGHVSELCRTRVGPFKKDATISLDKLEELSHSAAGQEGLDAVLEPVETALDDIPALAISGDDAAKLKRGQAVLLRGRDAPIINGPVYATSRGTLVALGEVKRGELRPKRVFNL
ncbi:MAG: tRNA pseudouridine(55) synthase TruB [Alphaproteobacteria bacterium]